ncbi:aminotransferase class IV [Alkaliphilus peptidifermentans]|uniref:Branched-chain amino acid aminotransferase n=1 Tax=Alkaliphilus peptidifermentans DSM 18978 TaxID=1120976 RepID=A0A1G5JEW3_9FIRM|nr:aminotransferase class IV [Alkaliphilus peptidifermentans]SCY86461.1 branched-chain amino acid aminotransferase [Alkaliphilus peptidifermentans DSM 18978]
MINKTKDVDLKYYIYNDEIFTVEDFNTDIIKKANSVYEVVRIMDGTPLFLEEHLDRLKKSIMLLNASYEPQVNKLIAQILKLTQINSVINHNIKIVVNELHTKIPNVILFFIPSNYPSEIHYREGVKTILFSTERTNPNAKVIMHQQRELLNNAIAEKKVYEAILVNTSGEITEGSRSNIFLVKNNSLYTAPSKDVLEGITRSRIIYLCNKIDVPVLECPIPVSFLDEIDGLFITGTSPKILPISSIDDKPFKSSENPVIYRLMSAYDQLISDYIRSTII